MSDRDKMLYDMLQKISSKTESIDSNIKNLEGNIGHLDKKVDLHIQKTELDLKAIHKLDEQQNALIDKHIEGVNTLKKMHETHLKESNKRFQEIEAPKKWFSITWKIVLGIGALAATGLTIARILEMF
jgi:septal ring factor EnvC (AmiA/AmiB activator)